MKEAFDVMSSHPSLTVFLGVVIIICVALISEAFDRRKN
jgi:hypothetical protein